MSTDYASGDPSTGTWTNLSAAVSPGSWTWTPSGEIDLSMFISGNTRIAFKYTGTSSDGKTWELDNIRINVD
ncbi:MAG: choice-of-anchor J domain-containing protein [Flavobacteriales bacterium]|nr:choice-of-anchor J domain-containing protein [Flavobacteriales bacterium]